MQYALPAAATMAGTPVIRTHALWKTYGSFHALQGVDLCVPEGSVFALLGENGAGKSTLIKCLLNIIAPTCGTACVLDVDSRRIGPAILTQIGYVSESQRLPARLHVEQFFHYLRACYPSWDRDREEALREQFRLPARRRIGVLSHGMRLKLALACALPFGPRLLILDEPFSGLDPLVRDEIIGGFIQQAGRLSIVISSHEMDELERLATHAAFVHAGRLLFQGPASALCERVSEMLPEAGRFGPGRAHLRDVFVAMARHARVVEAG